MTKRYCFIIPDGNDGVEEVCLTEDEIMEDHWLYWKGRVLEKYGEDKDLLTKEQCIIDWIQTHNAREKI